MSNIQRLPQDTINRIAAGEVVERPASAVKELVENAIDAGARHIDIRAEQGGLSRILIEDNGSGMAGPDLELAVERHATSKLKPQADGTWDLLHIQTLGFRGEALPSMGSVARLNIVSKSRGGDALAIQVDGGAVSGLKPAAFGGDHGTRIDLRDLFYATPARLKFMKSERSENMAIAEEVKRQAMAHEDVGFSLELDGKRVLKLFAEQAGFEGRLRRLAAILGSDFGDNALLIDQAREGVRLTGYAGLPTFSRGNAMHQYLFVNNRPVRDKLLTGALRAAYADFLARDRHPLAALFVEIDPQDLDVNVHPAKAEVRFRDPNLVRGLIIGALKHGLASAGHRAATTVAQTALTGFRVESVQPLLNLNRPTPSQIAAVRPYMAPEPFAPTARFEPVSYETAAYALGVSEAPVLERPVDVAASAVDAFPLGAARAQIHETYIIAQTADGLVIVDQHAAHERLVYEEMKVAMAQGHVQSQSLLIPEIVDLEREEVARLVARRDDLATMGLQVEAFGPTSVLVRDIPALMGDCDISGLVRDLVDDLTEHGELLALKERMAEICGDHACRHSVRSGRRLNAHEMNALLRQMEATPHSGQCNHGRPTYVELKLKDIEKLFGRR
ncbi:DNA mismatch repair protein MutL family protein [Asticcacaulis biprosthecium C19]|uniref:DNA mismatch repair protein MutL n=1 Tax=Asticcacaulis biprosthecium C19 TaxID=715226 RepID=F4QS28_9CAUL|nr:DNA mismatch repair endonuclease MutL [Asticcacaulis biprosthecium]EGF89548.1 DNA mismatch repair protein MutL family protein [Asticcacaulis biprosthecium C19]